MHFDKTKTEIHVFHIIEIIEIIFSSNVYIVILQEPIKSIID